MPYNGSGSFSPPGTDYPAVSGTLATAAHRNAVDADFASGLSTAVCKDGQTTITANLPMSGFKLTGLGTAAARTDSVSMADVQDSTGVYVGTVGGTADVITLTPAPAITAYTAGQTFRFIASGANTTIVTVNVNGLGAKSITKNGTSALVAGDIRTSAIVTITYDGSAFMMSTLGTSLGTGTINTCDFRLTLTTGTPVTTSDVTAAGTLYCAPYKGNRIALYDGSAVWNVRTSAEFSLALTLTSGKPYDIFCYDNGGVATLEALVWTNDTTRATALTRQDGVLVKTGATTRRYIGTIYASGANTTEDSLAKRYVWNFYNRVCRPMKAATETTDSWTYSTAAWRQANASTANQLDCVRGLDEDALSAVAIAGVANSGATVRSASVGIGVDATNAFSGLAGQIQADNTKIVASSAHYRGLPGVGRHFIAWLEFGAGADTQSWQGDSGAPSSVQFGIAGEGWA